MRYNNGNHYFYYQVCGMIEQNPLVQVIICQYIYHRHKIFINQKSITIDIIPMEGQSIPMHIIVDVSSTDHPSNLLPSERCAPIDLQPWLFSIVVGLKFIFKVLFVIFFNKLNYFVFIQSMILLCYEIIIYMKQRTIYQKQLSLTKNIIFKSYVHKIITKIYQESMWKNYPTQVQADW